MTQKRCKLNLVETGNFPKPQLTFKKFLRRTAPLPDNFPYLPFRLAKLLNSPIYFRNVKVLIRGAQMFRQKLNLPDVRNRDASPLPVDQRRPSPRIYRFPKSSARKGSGALNKKIPAVVNPHHVFARIVSLTNSVTSQFAVSGFSRVGR